MPSFLFLICENAKLYNLFESSNREFYRIKIIIIFLIKKKIKIEYVYIHRSIPQQLNNNVIITNTII